MLKTHINAAKAASFKLAESAISKSLPAFTITRSRGFLPREDPVQKLPTAFAPVESLLQRMTIHADGKQNSGLLATGQFGDAVKHELKGLNLEQKVDEVVLSNDQMMLSALFRDYSFLTSAYVLEPVDLEFRKSGTYSTGRNVLPRELAVPMKKLADALGHFPFMEYASSYALQNWARKDPAGKIAYDNLKLIRAFEDHEGSEKGFILVHVDMVANSGKLISAAEDCISAAATKNRSEFNAALTQLYSAYQAINQSMETMWGRSKPADYIKFRSFIFGTAPKEGNPMFPQGVIYEGVDDERPQYFRGESGANDSMIPLGDNLLEITASLPENELTSVLRDFRRYRPPTQREYIESIEARARLAKVKAFASTDAKSLALYVLNVDQIREFRNRHWSFTKEYIIRRSSYGIATGGSPILRYLPSNLATVNTVLEESCKALSGTSALVSLGLSECLIEAVDACRKRAEVQKRVLEAEMEVWALVSDQKKHEAERVRVSADLGEQKIMQRGWVGGDGVG
ncbi:hypothetical protein BOTBODRAFT_150132 [Botryobasidium botryosum FD-172 SS1]|uniref:Indoleamine 2,3-dioxygenase n=1 Tax=Botryobasidium botryosum (strain FD-172 SS1) TaxID=930990 RepID=A0A067NB84_BOTB1|nr:hypothetical protein BOTBODRAFT_150132 [Botryobasidium botryosum FD-172 SS1]